jgi:hypothetical protein
MNSLAAKLQVIEATVPGTTAPDVFLNAAMTRDNAIAGGGPRAVMMPPVPPSPETGIRTLSVRGLSFHWACTLSSLQVRLASGLGHPYGNPRWIGHVSLRKVAAKGLRPEGACRRIAGTVGDDTAAAWVRVMERRRQSPHPGPSPPQAVVRPRLTRAYIKLNCWNKCP